MKNYKIRGTKRTILGLLEIAAGFGTALICASLLLPVGILAFIWGYFAWDVIVYVRTACYALIAVSMLLILMGTLNLRTLGRYKRLVAAISHGRPMTLDLLADTIHRKRKKILQDVVSMKDEGHFDSICVLADCLVLESERFPQALMIGSEDGCGFAEGKRLFSGKFFIKETGVKEPMPYTDNEGACEKDPQAFVVAAGYGLAEEIKTIGRQTGNAKIKEHTDDISSTALQMLVFVEDKPEKIRSIRQIIDYDLPTICGLLRDYCELERQAIKGENILTGLAKIEDAMCTAAYDMRQELDMLYQDKVMNIAVDIEVMQSMMSENKSN